MSRISLFSKIKFFVVAFIANAAFMLVSGQSSSPDLKVDVDVNKGGSASADWMSNPLVWIIGALVLIIIIAVAARGGNGK